MRAPVGVHVPAEALYSSAEAKVVLPCPCPPAAKTLPLGSSTIWNRARAVMREPVGENAAGLYSSAEAKVVPPLLPPAARTLPLGSRNIWKFDRGVARDPVAVHMPPYKGPDRSVADVRIPPAARTLPRNPGCPDNETYTLKQCEIQHDDRGQAQHQEHLCTLMQKDRR